MPGSAVLDPALLSDQLALINDQARTLRASLGFAQYRVSLVTVPVISHRSGPTYAPVAAEVEISPAPDVTPWKTLSDQRYKLEACGLREAGLVQVDGVSLTYTEAELTGTASSSNETFFWKISDLRSQGVLPKWFVLDRPPYADRQCCASWTVWLKAAKGPDNV